jgi:hypothetical protein
MEICDIYGASNMTTKSHELLETETLLEKLIDTVSNVFDWYSSVPMY